MIKETGFIVLVAIGLALSFNAWFAPNPIPLIKKEYTSEKTSDEEFTKLTEGVTAPASAAPASTAPASTAPVTAPTPAPTSTAPVTAPTPAPSSTAPASTAPTTKDLTLKQVEKLLNNPNVQFIDARTADKYAQGHIGNAINVYGVEAQQRIPDLLAIPQDKIVVIYCDGGEECELSHMVADVMKNFGFQKIFIYKGGWEEWAKR